MLGLGNLFKKIFGSANERYLKTLQPRIDAINALESDFEALSDDALAGKTQEFRDRLKAGETVDDLLVDACFLQYHNDHDEHFLQSEQGLLRKQ